MQDVLDLYLCAMRVSEHEDVMTPSMVCLDGFFLSHSMQKVFVPEDDEAYDFVGEYVRRNMYLDPKDPMFVNDLCPTAEYTEMRYQQKAGFDAAAGVAEKVFAEYTKRFGREMGVVRPYMLDDAEVAVVTIGSMSGTAKYVVNQLREKGIKAGVLQLVMFRPFPTEIVRDLLKNVPVVGVVDRSAGLGGCCPPVCDEVKAALYGEKTQIYSYIGGLAGRDISNHSFEKIFGELVEIREGKRTENDQWFDLQGDPMALREVDF